MRDVIAPPNRWVFRRGPLRLAGARSSPGFHPRFHPVSCHIDRVLPVNANDTSQRKDVTDGAVITVAGRPIAVMGFTVAEGKIVEIDAIADPERVRWIAATVLTAE
jgi:hypothetical protein